MSGDVRKDFILTTVANYFAISPNGANLGSLNNSKELNNFLDDGNHYVLVSIYPKGRDIQLSNELFTSKTDEPCIVFFKIKPDVITSENIHSNVLVSSMFNSPVSTLYHSIKKIFGPLILNSDNSNKVIDPKLQNLLTDLESGLASYLRRSGDFDVSKENNKENFASILIPADEFNYWSELAKNRDQRAACFKEIFERCKYNQRCIVLIFFLWLNSKLR